MLKQILFLLFLSVILNANKSISISTGEWFPYSTNNQFQGVITEIVNATFLNSHKKIDITFESFETAYSKTLTGDYVAAYPFFKTDKRDKEMLFSEPLFKVENVLFYNKNSMFKKDLKTLKIGYVKGYAYKNIKTKDFLNSKIFENELDAFDMLDKGEISLLPSNKLVGIHIVKKYFNDFYSNIAILENDEYITYNTLHLILKKNKKNKKILDEFNTSLRELKKSGKYKKIILENNTLIEANLSSVIKLVNNTESFPMVIATESENSKEKYIIPRGTKAIVIKWSQYFKEKGKIKIYDEMFKKTKVKIVNGPLKGKILYVENMYIEID